MHIENNVIKKVLFFNAHRRKKYVHVLTAIILILANLHFINEIFIATNKPSFQVYSSDSENSVKSAMRSSLVAARSSCVTSEGLINDCSFSITNAVNERNNLIYVKYLYNLALTKINETIDAINSIPYAANNKTLTDLSATLQTKHTDLQRIINRIDSIITPLDRQELPSQLDLDALKSSSSSITSYLNTLIESFDSEINI